MKLNKTDLIKIYGGGLNGSLINAILSAINTLYNYGKNLGSSIRRISSNNICPL